MLFAGACRRYPSPPVDAPDPSDQCEQTIDLSKPGLPISWANQFCYSKPQFNKQNANQIIYLRAEKDQPGKQSLFAYDLGSNQFWPLIHNHPQLEVADFSCGPQGWILIQSKDFELWKMRANGTGLERMTFVKRDGFAYSPSWSGDGSLISFTVKKAIADVDGMTIIAQNNAKPLDTVYSATGPLLFTNDPAIMYSIDRNGVLTQYNSQTNKKHTYRPSTNDTFLRVCMMPDGLNLMACEKENIYLVDIAGSSRLPLRAVCANKQYLQPNLSNDGEWMVATKRSYTDDGINGIKLSSELYVMDKNCWHPKKILLP